MVSQSDIDKTLRRVVSPILRDSGFELVTARKAWAWRQDCIWISTLRSVGADFSGTGWPTASLTGWLSVFYPFIPFRGNPLRVDRKGRLLPDEAHGHFRGQLTRSLDQRHYTEKLPIAPERSRRDIWWISESEADLLPVAADIASAVVEQARPWFARWSDLPEAFRQIEAERDCLDKFHRAKYFAEHLGLSSKAQHYSEQFVVEARRLGYDDNGRPLPRPPRSRKQR